MSNYVLITHYLTEMWKSTTGNGRRNIIAYILLIGLNEVKFNTETYKYFLDSLKSNSIFEP